MRTKLAIGLALCLLAVTPLRAEKLSPEFRAAFEKIFQPGFTHAVVVKQGIPTTSIYGIEGDTNTGHYSIDIVNGQWKASEGFLDTDQAAADFLRKGEILKLDSVSYKDNRVDLRMVSLEAHEVTRGGWLLTDRKPEPVATNFKFFLPFPKNKILTSSDMPEVRRYIEDYFKVFTDSTSARAFSAQFLTGQAPAAGPQAGASPTVKKEIKVGMTALEVIEILGKPQKEVSFENQTRWTYPDLTVIFENGKVKEVRL
jgi:hypothetical protein